MSLLDSINSPADLRQLETKQLTELACDIKKFILESVAATGGHLASNLGAVELTLALHYVLNTPEDRIVWDVSHQAYCHKIITGRRDQFSTLRKFRGLSGFCKRSESEYDAFGAGHAITALSAAMGLCAGLSRNGSSAKVAAVIGDGTLTGGMAYEAFNNIKTIKKNLIVVLNDNEMSISKSVGAMADYLSRVTSSRVYNRVKTELENLMKKVPSIGEAIVKNTLKLEESLKNMIVPGVIFEEFGFRYFGPIDGHDIEHLITTLNNIKKIDSPVLLHVLTRKGQSYLHAEKSPRSFHGVSSFDIQTGKPVKSGSRSFTAAFSDAVVDLARENDKVVGITAAMTDGAGLNDLEKEFPDRFFDVGIAEPHAVTFAAGLAAEGMVPLVAIYSTFMQRAYDQVVHDAALQKLPVVLCLDRAGLVGADGPTHHGLFDISFLRHIPNLLLLSPRNEQELRDMLYTAVQYKEGPVAVRYPRGSVGNGPERGPFKLFDLEAVNYVRRASENNIVFATGTMVGVAEDAAQICAKQGVELSIVSAGVIKPLPSAYAQIVKRAKRVFTIEEHVVAGGFGSAVLEMAAAEKIPTPVTVIGLPDVFVEHGSVDELRELHGLSASKIAERLIAEIGSEKN